MRLLWLTAEGPDPVGTTGGALRQFNLISGLVKFGHEVTVVTSFPTGGDSFERTSASLSAAGAHLESVRRPNRFRHDLGFGVRADPRISLALARDPFFVVRDAVAWARIRPVAEELIGRRKYVIHIENDWSAAWARDLPPGLPKVLGLQNVGDAYYASIASSAAGMRKVLALGEAWRAARHNRRTLGLFRAATAVSDEDAARVRPLVRGPVRVIPNGTDLSVGPFDAEESEDWTLLFTGTMNHRPNIEAATALARDILPRVRAQLPQARLTIVGRDPVPAVTALQSEPGVVVTGGVRSIDRYFARAAVVAAPLASGGGTRLKILDALAAGRPVVSTTVGAEGLDLTPGEHYILADGSARFAAEVVRLLRDQDERRRLGRAGRQAVESRYGWGAIAERLSNALSEFDLGV